MGIISFKQRSACPKISNYFILNSLLKDRHVIPQVPKSGTERRQRKEILLLRHSVFHGYFDCSEFLRHRCPGDEEWRCPESSTDQGTLSFPRALWGSAGASSPSCTAALLGHRTQLRGVRIPCGCSQTWSSSWLTSKNQNCLIPLVLVFKTNQNENTG